MIKFPNIEDIKALWGKPKSIDNNKNIDYEKIVKEDEKQQEWEELIKKRFGVPKAKALKPIDQRPEDKAANNNNKSGTPNNTNINDKAKGSATISHKENDIVNNNDKDSLR